MTYKMQLVKKKKLNCAQTSFVCFKQAVHEQHEWLTKHKPQTHSLICHEWKENLSHMRLMRNQKEQSVLQILSVNFRSVLLTCRHHRTHVITMVTKGARTIVICPLKAAFNYKCSVPSRHMD